MKGKELVKQRFLRAWGEEEFGKKEEEFLRKYLLSDVDYKQAWEKKLQSIFSSSLDFPSKLFNEGYQTVSLMGGIIFSKDEFFQLQRCFEKTGDKWLLIIEDNAEEGSAIVKLKFPIKIEWHDLLGGGAISFEVFERPIRNYFVFGDTGLWGKYVGSDFDPPEDILGFQSEVQETFKKFVAKIA